MELSAYEALKSLFEIEVNQEIGALSRSNRNWTSSSRLDVGQNSSFLEDGAAKATAAAATFMFSDISDLGRRDDEGLVTGASATAAVKNLTSEEYEQFLADLWVGIVLTLMVLSCICCMCSCLLYHKFQQWKRTVFENRNQTQTHHQFETPGENESLPSYTIVSGLPSYDEALEQLRQIKTQNLSDHYKSSILPPNQQRNAPNSISLPQPPPFSPNTPQLSQLSVVDLIHIYKNNTDNKT